MTETRDDQALLVGARMYDDGALGEIYSRYSTELYRYAVRLLGDVHLAEDCVAETFSRFLQALAASGGLPGSRAGRRQRKRPERAGSGPDRSAAPTPGPAGGDAGPAPGAGSSISRGFLQ